MVDRPGEIPTIKGSWRDGKTAYVVNYNGTSPSDPEPTVVPVTIATRTAGTPIRLGYREAAAMALTRDGRTLYAVTGNGCCDLLLDGLAALFSEGYSAGLPILKRAVSGFGTDMSAAEQLRWLWLACVAALYLWDDASWDALSNRYVQLAREAGALSEVPLALSMRVYVHLLAGELTAAASLIEEVQAGMDATGSNLTPYGALGLAALRGRETESSALTEASGKELVLRGEGIGVTVTAWTHAVLLQRSRPLRESVRRGSAGVRIPPGRHGDLGRGRADRGSRPDREARDCGRGPSTAPPRSPRQRYRLGAWGGSAFAGALERGCGRRAPLR